MVWWLTKTTGSGVVLAIASLAGLLPQVLIGPFAGTLVDRWNRRLTMIVADSLVALATLLLAALFALGEIQAWHIYSLMFVRSVAGTFHWAAMQTSTSLMVPKEHLSRIQGVNQMLNGGLNIISAPLGALLLELLPMEGEERFEGLQRFFQSVHDLTRERRLSRIAYLVEKPTD